MKDNKNAKILLKTGAIVLGGTLIMSIPVSFVHALDDARRLNAEHVISSEIDLSIIDANKTLDCYLNSNGVIKINDCKDEELYTNSSSIVVTGNQIEKYLLAHEIDTIFIDGKCFTTDGRTLKVLEEKLSDKVVNDGSYFYVGSEGYVLDENAYKKIKDIETISYSELENYALLKTVNVYYSDSLDTTPKHSSSYSLIKLK